MAIEDVFRDPDSGEYEQSQEGSRTWRESWTVVADTVSVGPKAVIAAAGLPEIGDTYSFGGETDGSLVCRRVRPRRDASAPRVWRVDVEYTYQPSSGGGAGGEGGELTLRLPEIELYDVPYSKPAERDIEGNPVVNSAGMPFDPPAEMDAFRLGLRITRYETVNPYLLAKEYRNAINTDALWEGEPYETSPHHVKMQGITSRRVVSNDRFYWHTTYDMHVNDESWIVELVDQGFYRIAGSTGSGDIDRQRILDAKGQPVEQAALLDGAGQPLAKDLPAVTRSFHLYRELMFGPLNLPKLEVEIF